MEKIIIRISLEIPFHQIGGEIYFLNLPDGWEILSRNTFPPNRWRNFNEKDIETYIA